MKAKTEYNLIPLLAGIIVGALVGYGILAIFQSSPFGAFRPAAPTATSTGNKYLDDRELAFGTDEDFQLKYDSTEAQFEWSDGTNNFFIMEDSGTTASTTFVGTFDVDSTLTVGGVAVVTSTLFPHDLMNDDWHTDTTQASASRGSLIYGQAADNWQELTIGASNSFIMSDGTDLSWNDLQDKYLLNTGDIGTGVYDFGGATSFEIVNGANPTVDTLGEFALDTTEDQLVFFGSTGVGAITATRSYAWGLASASIKFTHLDGPMIPYDYTISSASCRSGNVDGEIVIIDIYECDGTAGTCSEHLNTASVSCDNNVTSFVLNDYAGDKDDFYQIKVHSVNDALEADDGIVVNLWGEATRK